MSYVETLETLGFILLPNLVGIPAGIMCKKETKGLFKRLKRPKWRPPNWMHTPVWTCLYTTMGYASYLVYRDGDGFEGPARIPLAIYAANLLVNSAWAPVFFKLQRYGVALGIGQIVNATAVGMAYHFYEINSIAGYLIVPYCLWLALATALGYKIYRDN